MRQVYPDSDHACPRLLRCWSALKHHSPTGGILRSKGPQRAQGDNRDAPNVGRSSMSGFRAGPHPTAAASRRDSAWSPRSREAFGVRQIAGAVEAALYYRRPTAPALLPTSDRSFWEPDHTHRWRPQFHPGPGWVDLNRRKGPEDSKAPPAEPLPHEAGEVAGGRQKMQTRPRAGRFLSKGCNSLFEQTLRTHLLCAGQSRGNVEGSGVSVRLPVVGTRKVKCARGERCGCGWQIPQVGPPHAVSSAAHGNWAPVSHTGAGAGSAPVHSGRGTAPVSAPLPRFVLERRGRRGPPPVHWGAVPRRLHPEGTFARAGRSSIGSVQSLSDWGRMPWEPSLAAGVGRAPAPVLGAASPWLRVIIVVAPPARRTRLPHSCPGGLENGRSRVLYRG